MTRFATIAIAALALTVTASNAFAVSASVKRACIGDYFAYCSNYAPGGSGVKSCMRRNASKLSNTCKTALIKAGYAKNHSVAAR